MFAHEKQATDAVVAMLRASPDDDLFRMALARVMLVLGARALAQSIGYATTMGLLHGLIETLQEEHGCADCGDRGSCLAVNGFKHPKPDPKDSN